MFELLEGYSKPYTAFAQWPQFSSQLAFLICESIAHVYLHAGLKNSLKLLFLVFSYTQVQARRPESPPFNLKGYSVLWNFTINYTIQFTIAILILYLSTISISHFEGPKSRFSLPVSLSFTQPNIILMLLNCRTAQGTCTQLIIYHDLQSFLCHCISRRKRYPVSENCILVHRSQWIYSNQSILFKSGLIFI